MKIKLWIENIDGDVLEELGYCLTDNPTRAAQMYDDNLQYWADLGHACVINWREKYYSLRDYVSDHNNFDYVGSIWGEYQGQMSSDDTLLCLDCLDAGDPELIDHPSLPGNSTATGYYLQSDNLHYKGSDGSFECILIAID